LLPGSHEAIQAILAVMSARSEKGYYIQTSGAFLVAENTGGSAGSGKTWSDIADIDAIVAMPPTSFHQPTEQLVRNAATNVNVAIVSPTVVYGLSRGVEHQAPITIRDIVKTITELGTGFTMSRGANVIGYIHVDDLADIYVRLLADALQGGQGPELWGPRAYYFAVGEEISFAAYMKALVEVLQQKGILSTDVIREIGDGTDAADQRIVAKTAAVHGCGLEVRCQSDRARKLLGWKSESSGLIGTLPAVVDSLLQRHTR
jgi:nucleoside-diphosphate-sugar epimerase